MEGSSDTYSARTDAQQLSKPCHKMTLIVALNIDHISAGVDAAVGGGG
jgi:hypothetical protein